ncbi:MAG: hypothetical protein HQK51_12075 [Oligoflexia bacterium]|nr:hypothetical protein [Oligoflexia bacterium]
MERRSKSLLLSMSLSIAISRLLIFLLFLSLNFNTFAQQEKEDTSLSETVEVAKMGLESFIDPTIKPATSCGGGESASVTMRTSKIENIPSVIKDGISLDCLNASEEKPYKGTTPYRVQVIGYYHDDPPTELDYFGYGIGKSLYGYEGVGHAALRVTDMRNIDEQEKGEKSYISFPYGTTFEQDSENEDYNHRKYVEFCVEEKKYLSYAKWAKKSEFVKDSDNPIEKQIEEVKETCKTDSFEKFYKKNNFKLNRFLLAAKKKLSVKEIIDANFFSKTEVCEISAVSLEDDDKKDSINLDEEAPVIVDQKDKILFYGDKKELIEIDKKSNLKDQLPASEAFDEYHTFKKVTLPAKFCKLLEKKSAQKLKMQEIKIDNAGIEKKVDQCMQEILYLKELETPLNKTARIKVEKENKVYLEQMGKLLNIKDSVEVENLLLLNDENYQQDGYEGEDSRNAVEIISSNIFNKKMEKLKTKIKEIKDILDPKLNELKVELKNLKKKKENFKDILNKYQKNEFRLNTKYEGINAAYSHTYSFTGKSCSHASREGLRVLLDKPWFYTTILTNPKNLVIATDKFITNIFATTKDKKGYIELTDNGKKEKQKDDDEDEENQE